MDALVAGHERDSGNTPKTLAGQGASGCLSTHVHRLAVSSVAILPDKATQIGRKPGMKEGPSIILDHRHLEREELKAQYLACLTRVSPHCPSLRQIVHRLLEAAVHWRELLRWADDAGCGHRYVRKVLSEILCEAGIRRRRAGAGRATPQEALAILAATRLQYGPDTARLLGAAYRAAKAEDAQQEAAGAADVNEEVA